MAWDGTLKDTIRESLLFRNRSIVAVFLTVLLLAILIVRLAYLQVLSHQHYTTLSNNNRVDIEPIAPTRGLIYDRNGVLLAENLPTYRLEIIPEQVEDMTATLKAVSELIDLSGEEIAQFRRHLLRKRRFEAIPLRYRLSDEEVARIAINRYRLPGVEINSHLTRAYPHGELTAHTVGYVGRINERELSAVNDSNYSATSHIGKVGIEKAYEDVLHGNVGFQQVETNARGRVLRVLERTPPTPGQNLYLTLDLRLQKAAAESFGHNRGALVAIDPRDGSVLAFVSQPSFDPNLFVNGIGATAYRALTGSRDRPLFNRALRGQYPPGSTTKPFVGLAGLEDGVIRADHQVFCPGWFQLKGDDHRYRDWKKTGHGHVDLDKAIVQSCDVYFYSLAMNLGIDRLSAFMQEFGFGSRTGIDILGEASGLMPSREWKKRVHRQPWFPGETVITGIGQGFELATPLQLAANTGALAVNGKRFKPHLLLATQTPNQPDKQPFKPQSLPAVPIKDQRNWDYIHNAMTRVVNSAHGTARKVGHGAPYTIAGKTGTAQVFGIAQGEEYVKADVAKRLRDHALFIAYAPAEAPTIAVAVVVENGGSGGSVAGPIARRVMDVYFGVDDKEGNP